MSAAVSVDPWLGEIPAERAPIGRPAKGHTGRQRKTLCPSCGFIAYVTAGAVKRAGGLPSCVCGARMEVPNLRDRAAIEPDALEAELLAMGRDAYIAAMRELGENPYGVVGPAKVRRDGGGARRSRCASCSKFTNGRTYCPEHDPMTAKLPSANYADRRGVA